MLNFTFSSDNDDRAVGSGSYLCKVNGSVEYSEIFNWLYFDGAGGNKQIGRLGPIKEGLIGCPSSFNISAYKRAIMYNIDLRGGPWWSSYSPTRYGKVITDQSLWPGPPYGSGTPVYKVGGQFLRVARPSEFIMFVDSESSGDVLNPNFANEGAFTSSISYSNGTLLMGRLAFRHLKKSTNSYTDGHASVASPFYSNYQKSKIYFEHQ